jgi:hypothetical protein
MNSSGDITIRMVPVLVRALESQHEIASAVEFELFIGDGGAGDVATQLLQFFTLIHGAAHLGVEAEPLFADTVFLGMLRIFVHSKVPLQSWMWIDRSLWPA